jgi:hypothetical protein
MFLFYVVAGLALLLQVLTEGTQIGHYDESLRIWAGVATLGAGALIFWYLPRNDHDGEWHWTDVRFMVVACVALAVTLPQAVNRLVPRARPQVFELPVTDIYTTKSRKRLFRPQSRFRHAITVEPLPPFGWLHVPASSLRVDRGECLKAIVHFGLLGENWISHMVPIPCSPERGIPAPLGELTIAWQDGFRSWKWTTMPIAWGPDFQLWKDELIGELLSLPDPGHPIELQMAVAPDSGGVVNDVRIIRSSGMPSFDEAALRSLGSPRTLLTPRAVENAAENGWVILPTIRLIDGRVRLDESLVSSDW